MKFIDEFRQKESSQGLLKKIRDISTKKVNIMEICGTHTHTISKYGIRDTLPSNIRLISGPGCPVCVTASGDIDKIIAFIKDEKNVIIATFGDMMRVPGTVSSLQEQKADGSDIRVVYSPLGSLDIAAANPTKEVVLFAVGFETTIPTVAATIYLAKERKMKNFSAFTLHKLTPPAMKALMDSGELNLHGFLCPGHVTAVIGAHAYKFLSDDYNTPCVVAGFEPLDAIHGLFILTKQLEEGNAEIIIQYKRVVTWEGNKKAQQMMEQVFEKCDSVWRGFGKIPMSGLRMRDEYSDYNAECKFEMPAIDYEDPGACTCGNVLKGLSSPNQCPFFSTACTPETPLGPCMVSSEGTCAAYYKYGVPTTAI
jgi:hydrogenase expression/formation protein HypD